MQKLIDKLAGMVSATKITLLGFASATCAGFLYGLISPEIFMGAAMLVLGFYFGRGNTQQPNQ